MLLTSLAALLQLRPELSALPPTIEAASAPMDDGVLRGNQTARLGGDPTTFTRQHLHNIMDELRKHGIKQVTGDLIIDTSVFCQP